MIREAKIEDLNEVCDMGWELNKIHANIDELMKPKVDAYKEYEDAYAKWIKDENYFFYVAEVEGDIAGFVVGTIQDTEPIDEIRKKGYLIAMFVKPEFRKQGLMKQLTQTIENTFKERGIPYISLVVHQKNPNAITAWEQLGYQTTSVTMTKKI